MLMTQQLMRLAEDCQRLAAAPESTGEDLAQCLARVLAPASCGPVAGVAALETLLGAVAHAQAQAWLPMFLQTYAALWRGGYRLDAKWLEIEPGYAVQAAPTLTVRKGILGYWAPTLSNREPARVAQVIVVQSPALNAVAVLNQVQGQWSLHLRQYWEELGTSTPAHEPLSFEQAVQRAPELMARYADDFTDATVPHRLSLSGILLEPPFAGDRGASRALRWADGRDAGYLLSTAPPEQPQVAPDMLGDCFLKASQVSSIVYKAAKLLGIDGIR